MSSKKRLTSLQSLRTIAFLGIFLIHAGCVYEWATLGVSIFFVMSGFLMVYSYEDKNLSLNIKDCFLFSVNKIKKLYPLHIITMLIMVLRLGYVMITSNNFTAITSIVKNVILNILLIQTWVPVVEVNVALNGVAWYLSVCLFLYFIFPYIMKLIKWIDKKAVLLAIGIALWCVLYLVAVLSVDKVGLDGRFFTWITYCFPLYRAGDFILGAIAGFLFVHEKPREANPVFATIAEFAVFALCYIFYSFIATPQQSIWMRALTENWTLGFIPLAIMLVVFFARSEGYITKLLNNRLLNYLGDISAYMFLIHYVITQLGKGFVASHRIILNTFSAILVLVIEFAITVGVSALYSYLVAFFKKKERF